MFLALAVLLAPSLHAQEVEARREAGGPVVATPDGSSAGGEWWTELTWGVHAESVAKVHLSGGFFLAKKTINPYASPGCIFLAEPGLEAAKLSAGCGYLTVFGSTVARAVVMRTFDDPMHGRPWSTYVGVEGQVPVWMRTLLRVGAFRGAGSGVSGDWLFTVSIGYGI